MRYVFAAFEKTYKNTYLAYRYLLGAVIFAFWFLNIYLDFVLVQVEVAHICYSGSECFHSLIFCRTWRSLISGQLLPKLIHKKQKQKKNEMALQK